MPLDSRSTSDVETETTLLSVQWASNIDGVLSNDAPDQLGQMSFQSVLSSGTHIITLLVDDNMGGNYSCRFNGTSRFSTNSWYSRTHQMAITLMLVKILHSQEPYQIWKMPRIRYLLLGYQLRWCCCNAEC